MIRGQGTHKDHKMTVRQYHPICSVSECMADHFCKGFCRKHFERWKRHGDPNKTLKVMVATRGEPLQWLIRHSSYEDEGCLVWPFARFPDGRAHMAKGRPARIMCEIVHGAAPKGAEAAHSCGNANGGCVHPKHLRWATPLENASDKEAHGTIVRGAAHHKAKLSEEDVLSIRKLNGNVPRRDIARAFGIGKMHVSRIVTRQAWKHVP
jgi:hypothetical protein